MAMARPRISDGNLDEWIAVRQIIFASGDVIQPGQNVAEFGKRRIRRWRRRRAIGLAGHPWTEQRLAVAESRGYEIQDGKPDFAPKEPKWLRTLGEIPPSEREPETTGEPTTPDESKPEGGDGVTTSPPEAAPGDKTTEATAGEPASESEAVSPEAGTEGATDGGTPPE